jgi:hypothetical protein
MHTPRRAALVLAALVGLAGASHAQSYGDGDQTLTIGAAELDRALPIRDYILDADGYVYGEDPKAYTAFRAPLNLPEGAMIEQLCLYFNDSDPARVAGAYLSVMKLVPGGGSPVEAHVPWSSAVSSDVGYGFACSSNLSYQLRSTFDIDYDGVVDHLSYAVVAYLSNMVDGAPSQLGVGGVRITWKRAVSPPSEAPVFVDVPDGDPFRQYIEALAASGITAGCGNGNYCPDATLTRRQMAVFLAKALGLHWSNP